MMEQKKSKNHVNIFFLSIKNLHINENCEGSKDN